MGNQEATHIVTGVIGSDVHNIGVTLIEHALQRAGYKVVSLGIQVSQEEFIQAAIETNAAAIFVSSVYGHAELDCQGLREKCMETGLKGILLYVGGNLAIGKQDWAPVEKKFKEMGFDRVFPPGSSPSDALAYLQKDLSAQRGGKYASQK